MLKEQGARVFLEREARRVRKFDRAANEHLPERRGTCARASTAREARWSPMTHAETCALLWPVSLAYEPELKVGFLRRQGPDAAGMCASRRRAVRKLDRPCKLVGSFGRTSLCTLRGRLVVESACSQRKDYVPTWLWIVIIVIVVLAILGFFGRGRFSR